MEVNGGSLSLSLCLKLYWVLVSMNSIFRIRTISLPLTMLSNYLTVMKKNVALQKESGCSFFGKYYSVYICFTLQRVLEITGVHDAKRTVPRTVKEIFVTKRVEVVPVSINKLK